MDDTPTPTRIHWPSSTAHSLIKRVRNHPELWDHTHQHFCRFTLKRIKWMDIARELRQEFPELDTAGITERDVQKKFSILKSTFQREVRKIHNTSSGSDGILEPKWEYFKTCLFMLPETHPSTVAHSSDEDMNFYDEFKSEGPSFMTTNDHLSTPSSSHIATSDEASVFYVPSPTSSSGQSETCSPTLPPRKKRKKAPQPEKFHETYEEVNDVLGSMKRSNKIIQATTDLVNGFMGLLSEKQQLQVAKKIRKLLQEHHIPDD